MRNSLSKAASACVAGVLSLTAACSSTGSGSGEGVGGTLKNFLFFGGATVPAAAPGAIIEVVDCPAVTVVEGGAMIRTGGTDASAVRSQLAIADVARECTARDDGGITVKIGVQVRALVGPGGGAPRFDSPIRFALKRGDTVLASRTARVSVAVPPGEYERSVIVVEDGLVAPPGEGDLDIEVGFGTGPKAAAPARRTRAKRG